MTGAAAAAVGAGVATVAKGEVRRGGMPSAHAAAAAAMLAASSSPRALPVLAAGLLLIDAARYHAPAELAAGAALGATVGYLVRSW